MSYTLRDHTADVAVEATAPSLGGVFAAVAEGMAAAMCEDAPVEGARFEINVTAESRTALLFDYLDHLIYERDVRQVLPVNHAATVRTEPWQVSGQYTGVPLESVTARNLKAVTYSEMELSEQSDGWYAYVVFDV